MNIDEEVRIRTKTINGLNLEKDPYKKNKFIEIITNFRETTFSNAFRTIFLLLYGLNEENFDNRIEILHRFNFTCAQEDLPYYDYLTEDQIIVLGNELRYQYCKANPDFLTVEEDCAYHEELITLKNAMSEHPLLFFKAVKSCKERSTEEYVSICVEPLLSNTHYSQSYGLRKLGHNRHYCELLLPYAKEIGNLLIAMYDTKQQEEEIITQYVEEFSNETFEENSSKEVVEAPCIKVETQEENHPEIEKDEIQKAFDEKKYSDDEFCKRLVHLYNHGVDLNLLARNMSENKIENISDSLKVVLQEIDSFDETITAFDEVLDTLYDVVGSLRATLNKSTKYFVRA